MSRLAGDMRGFVVLGVYRSTVKKQNKEKTLLWKLTLYEYHIIRDQTHSKVFVSKILISMENSYVPPVKRNSFTGVGVHYNTISHI